MANSTSIYTFPRHCLFVSNQAGAGSPGGVEVGNNSKMDFINCTFADNSAGGGGALHLRRVGTANVINSIFWGNRPNQISLLTVDTSGCALTLNHCDIQDSIDSIAVSDSMSIVNWGTGNLSVYPLFVDSANGDFHLQDSSDCIGAGVDSLQIGGLWYYSPIMDIENHPRPDPSGSEPDLGAYENSLGNPPVGIFSNSESVSCEFKLYQNYPNPFNPITLIEFDLPAETFVTLKIYNTLGEEVAVVMENQRMCYGLQEIDFNASQISSGVYFYRIQAESITGVKESYTKTKKMLILK